MKMKKIHHISAIVGHPQETYDFYTNILGLHLIKKTVNFDDPTTYHLYFGDEFAENGFTMTFFNWEQSNKKGRVGSGQVRTIAFAVGENSIKDWEEHLTSHNVDTKRTQRFNKETLEFNDSHGLSLALVEKESFTNPQIQDFYGVEILSGNYDGSSNHLTNVFHLKSNEESVTHQYFVTDSTVQHTIALSKEKVRRGIDGIGTVHHVAWEADDSESLKDWQKTVLSSGLQPTEVKDRLYFESIYYREPGFTIYEIATAGPGFDVDEGKESLGTSLKLPPQYEASREKIEAHLSPIEVNKDA